MELVLAFSFALDRALHSVAWPDCARCCCLEGLFNGFGAKRSRDVEEMLRGRGAGELYGAVPKGFFYFQVNLRSNSWPK